MVAGVAVVVTAVVTIAIMFILQVALSAGTGSSRLQPPNGVATAPSHIELAAAPPHGVLPAALPTTTTQATALPTTPATALPATTTTSPALSPAVWPASPLPSPGETGGIDSAAASPTPVAVRPLVPPVTWLQSTTSIIPFIATTADGVTLFARANASDASALRQAALDAAAMGTASVLACNAAPKVPRFPPPGESAIWSGGERRLLVVSPGGVATSSAMYGLRSAIAPAGYVLSNPDDSDNLKHRFMDGLTGCTAAWLTCFAPDRIFYLFGEPLEAAASHFRRKWADVQLTKMNPHAATMLNASSAMARAVLASNWTDYLAAIPSPPTVASVDVFGIMDHITGWYNAAVAGALPAPILFLDVATLLATQGAPLAPFLGVPPSLLSHLTASPILRRHIDPAAIPPAILAVYDDAYAAIRHLDTVVINPLSRYATQP